MIQKHCVECGTALIEKELEEEGIVPYCPKCQQYRFPMYNVAVSMIVVDEETGKILLIQQYGKPSYILVAGYVNRGEAEEHAVVREVREETGLEVEHFRFSRTRFFEPSNTLMCNFTAFVRTAKALHINQHIGHFCDLFFYAPNENDGSQHSHNSNHNGQENDDFHIGYTSLLKR